MPPQPHAYCHPNRFRVEKEEIIVQGFYRDNIPPFPPQKECVSPWLPSPCSLWPVWSPVQRPPGSPCSAPAWVACSAPAGGACSAPAPAGVDELRCLRTPAPACLDGIAPRCLRSARCLFSTRPCACSALKSMSLSACSPAAGTCPAPGQTYPTQPELLPMRSSMRTCGLSLAPGACSAPFSPGNMRASSLQRVQRNVRLAHCEGAGSAPHPPYSCSCVPTPPVCLRVLHMTD